MNMLIKYSNKIHVGINKNLKNGSKPHNNIDFYIWIILIWGYLSNIKLVTFEFKLMFHYIF